MLHLRVGYDKEAGELLDHNYQGLNMMIFNF